MTSLLSRTVTALRVWLGLNDPVENHLYASHGWLLQPSAVLRARALARVPMSVPGVLAPVNGKGR